MFLCSTCSYLLALPLASLLLQNTILNAELNVNYPVHKLMFMSSSVELRLGLRLHCTSPDNNGPFQPLSLCVRTYIEPLPSIYKKSQSPNKSKHMLWDLMQMTSFVKASFFSRPMIQPEETHIGLMQRSRISMFSSIFFLKTKKLSKTSKTLVTYLDWWISMLTRSDRACSWYVC